MIHDVGRNILIKAEQKFGKLAIPGLLKWIAGFQLLSWALGMANPAFGEAMLFDLDKIMGGEVWRIVSWVFMPRTTSFLFIVITTLFMFFISDGLESAWESFRLNVYVVATILFLIISGLIVPMVFPLDPGYEKAVYSFMSMVFYSAIFLAFAALYPNQIIHLMMIIPIKVKWLGLLSVGLLLLTIMSGPILAFVAMLGLLPFLLVFVPTFFQNVKLNSDNATRRAAFRETIDSGDAFHVCEVCKKTEIDDPYLEFRVAADGEEYCVDHLPKIKD